MITRHFVSVLRLSSYLPLILLSTSLSDDIVKEEVTMSNTKGKEKEKPLASLLAGATAGGIEAFVTYPFESLKTQLQFGALNGEKVHILSFFPRYRKSS